MRRKLELLIFALLCAACSATPFRDHTGPDLRDEQVAILKWSLEVSVREIDGKKTDLRGLVASGHWPQTQARLLPGRHVIRFGGCFRRGFYVPTFHCRDWTAELEMKAGHVYAMKHARRRGFFIDDVRDHIWIEDRTTGAMWPGTTRVVPGSPSGRPSAEGQ